MDNKNTSSARLRKILFLYLIIALLILSILLSISIILPFYSRLKDAENRNLVHAVAMKTMSVSEWGRHAKDIALQITSRSRIRQELEKYNEGEITLNEITSFSTPKLNDAMDLSNEIIGITRLDLKNRVVAECGIAIQKSNWPSLDFTNGNINVSVPIKVQNRLVIIVGAKIQTRENKRVGTDLVVIDMEYLRAIIDSSSGLARV